MSPQTGEVRAVCVMARREFIRGTIETVKDQVRLDVTVVCVTHRMHSIHIACPLSELL